MNKLKRALKYISKPKVGEWWMCQGESGRICPMIKTSSGWGSICDKNEKPLKDYIQTKPIIKPKYRMIRS